MLGEAQGFSIHPGPGELVRQVHLHLEVQNLPEKQTNTQKKQTKQKTKMKTNI